MRLAQVWYMGLFANLIMPLVVMQKGNLVYLTTIVFESLLHSKVVGRPHTQLQWCTKQ